MVLHGYLRRSIVNNIIYDTNGTCEGQHGCTQGPIRDHARVDMGSRERDVIGLESQAVSA